MKKLVAIALGIVAFTGAANGWDSKRRKPFTANVRILAELPNPFEDGLKTEGPRHRNFVIQAQGRPNAIYFLLRFEYDSWKKDELGSDALNGTTIWKIRGVEEKYCSSSIRVLLAVNSPEPSLIKIADTKPTLPPDDRILQCVASGDVTPVR